jgi:predicted aspartyl protease/Flp pilus assembly protein TadD
MTVRTRLAVVLACVCVLSWSVVAAGRKVSAATAAAQIAVADVLYEHADYRSAMQTYLAATSCEDATLRDRARAGSVRAALRIAEFGVALTQLAGMDGRAATDPATLALAGDALWASGRFDEGEAAYLNALSLDPASPRARLGLAKSLASRNRMESALDQAQAALRGAPGDADIRHALGSIYERMHRYGEAATAYLSYLSALKGADRFDHVQWARSHISFLRSFEGTVPFEMVSKRNVTEHVLEFRLVNGKVVLKGKINGGRAVDLTLDTGAEHTALSEKTAGRFGVQGISETLTAGVGEVGLRGLRVARLRSLEIGTLTVYNLPCVIKSPSMPGLPVDTTDGFSPLALGLSMRVDYRARRVYLGELTADPSPARELPLRLNRLATVEGRVNDIPMSFIVDTGGEGILVSASAARGIFTPADRHRIKLRVYGSSGFDPDAYLLPGLDLSFGPLSLRNQPVVVLDLRAPSVLLGYDVGGVLGYCLLGRYRVDFDLARSVLRLRDL